MNQPASFDFKLAQHRVSFLSQLKAKSLGMARFCIKPLVLGQLPLKVALKADNHKDALHKQIMIKVGPAAQFYMTCNVLTIPTSPQWGTAD